MNVYDFDGTILHGDSEDYFFIYALEHFKIKFRHRVEMKFFNFLGKKGWIKAKTYTNHIYPYLKYVPNLESEIKTFWDIHEKDVYPHYHKLHQIDDVVISNTPRFLLEEIIRRLKIKTLIATELDINTGKVIGESCKGEEKLRRYEGVFKQTPFENYYFDQDHDMPVLKYAKNGYRVYNGELKKIK